MSADIAGLIQEGSVPPRAVVSRAAESAAQADHHDQIASDFQAPVPTPPVIKLATAAQRRFGLVISIVITVGTLLLMPLAQVRWPNIPAFLQVYQTAVIGICLVTACLMYGHYKATRLAGLLHLSGGYLYTAGILIMQFLSFPGAFTESDRVFGGSQTTIWL